MTKDEIVAEIRRTRAAMATDSASVKRELDFSTKFKAVVRRNPWPWVGGAAVLGWWLAGAKTKTRVVTKTINQKGEKVKAPAKMAKKTGKLGLLIALVRFAMPYLRPALSSYATQFASQMSERIATARRPD